MEPLQWHAIRQRPDLQPYLDNGVRSRDWRWRQGHRTCQGSLLLDRSGDGDAAQECSLRQRQKKAPTSHQREPVRQRVASL